MIDALIGLQFGDCGKGKIIDLISNNYDMVARFNGSDNAGHSIVINGKKKVLHLIPSGIFQSNCINIIGSGCIVNPISLVDEIAELEDLGIDVRSKLKISKRAHLILPTHKLLDKSSELSKGNKKIGSTLKGIGPTYMDKVGRNGIRVGDILSNIEEKYNDLKNKHLSLLNQNDLFNEWCNTEYKNGILSFLDNKDKNWFESIKILKTFDLIDSEYYINTMLEEGKTLLAEGAQGTLLDIDYGTYPYVTSSNTTISGIYSGLGISPKNTRSIIGVCKSYITRVGNGPFTTELNNEIGYKIREIGSEFGSTTGRPRRCGWLDIPLLKYSIMINGVTELNIMKLDVLSYFDKIKVCIGYKLEDGSYTDKVPYDISDITPIYIEMNGWNKNISDCVRFEDLPEEAKEYISLIQINTGIPVTKISVGPDRNQTIIL